MTAPMAFSASGGPGAKFINYYDIIAQNLGFQPNGDTYDQYKVFVPLLASITILLVLVIVGFLYKKAAGKKISSQDIAPASSFGLMTFIEMILGFVTDMADDVIGKNESRKHYSLLCSLFLYIFFSNLSGLIPGFPPATENFSINLALAAVVFLWYNLAGIKEHGGAYIKQFIGPFVVLIPLMFLIEFIGHLVRPVSLGLRLYGNIFGDHLVMSVFTSLSYVVVPGLLLFFGLLVATIQSFIFTLLSSIYISMAVSHDH